MRIQILILEFKGLRRQVLSILRHKHKTCYNKGIWQTENGLEHGFVKHQLNSG